MSFHVPVLAGESLTGLHLRDGGIYVDATFGGGGHSRIILERMQGGKLYAFDQDEDAVKNAWPDSRLKVIRLNFRHIASALKEEGVEGVDGILADLGVSSWQFDTAERGFSTRFSGPLDMRMDRDEALSAEAVVNEYSESGLAGLLKEYGEISRPGSVARAIVKERKKGRINDTGRFASMLSALAPRGKENKFLAQVFQAIRMEVNDEPGALKEFLAGAGRVIKPGGRLVVISYHSLEDRMVKHYLRTGNTDGRDEKDIYGNRHLPFREIGRKPVVPSDEEIQRNSRARSARMRIGEKTPLRE